MTHDFLCLEVKFRKNKGQIPYDDFISNMQYTRVELGELYLYFLENFWEMHSLHHKVSWWETKRMDGRKTRDSSP